MQYAYMRIYWSGRGVTLDCTDIETRDWVVSELQRRIPNLKVGSHWKEIDGDQYRTNFSNLGGKDFEIAWWIIKQLCLQGWQPFAAWWADEHHVEEVVHLRLDCSHLMENKL